MPAKPEKFFYPLAELRIRPIFVSLWKKPPKAYKGDIELFFL
jgi:hypothetical protein